MLKTSALTQLKEGKNLLAFSAGGDSTALFFLLLQHQIPFDIAIIDYELRLQSKDEVHYAQALAQKHQLHCFTHTASKIATNFEANARAIRYEFFEKIIQERHYTNLLTAHHLGDRFEWMLMQFCKGAGCAELGGMQAVEQRENYTLLRPLLHLDKSELLSFLNKEKIHYFEDASNKDTKYKRNEFRLNHAQPLLQKYRQGIEKSFQYLDSDIKEIIHKVTLHTYDDFSYFQSSGDKRSDIFHIDKALKRRGYLLTAPERELLKSQEEVIIARKILLVQQHNFVFILPYIQTQTMPKVFKEEMRLLKIAPKMRGYLFKYPQMKELVASLL